VAFIEEREEEDMANNQEILDALREALVDRLKVDEDRVTLEADLFADLGLDSIGLTSAVMAIEDRFGFEVSDAELESVTTVREAVDLLGSKVAAGA
jgi:acyl carrier protein